MDATQEHRLDSTAAEGFLRRRGSGSMKHIETKHMWSQAYLKKYNVRVNKIPRAANCADALASPCGVQDLRRHLEMMNVYVLPGEMLHGLERERYCHRTPSRPKKTIQGICILLA